MGGPHARVPAGLGGGPAARLERLPARRGRMWGMICVSCRERCHQDCPGGTWCDCQHEPPPQQQPEPALGWIRQG